MKTVGGWGVNDLGYEVGGRIIVDGVRKFKVTCPFYVKWQSMINRTHNPKYKQNQKTYEEASIVEGWKYASNFKSWMETQDWEEYHLDKDILIPGSKEYGPNACCFVPQYINNLITQRTASRGQYPLGVHYNKAKSPYKATCHNGYEKVYLGRFSDPISAHRAWQEAKPSAILAGIERWLSSGRKAPRQDIVDALVNRAGKITEDLLNNRVTEYY